MKAATVAVSGAGPVGLALACSLPDMHVHVLDGAARPPDPGDEYDARIFALSAGTRSFLRDAGAWERLDAARVAPVRRMEVFGDAGARLAFAGRPGVALAWIVEAGRLGRALEEEAVAAGNVAIARGVALERFEAREEGVRVMLQDGAELSVDLLVGADGPESHVRRSLGVPVEATAYGETALAANFECEKDHGNVARQWFAADGVMAWLPLPGRRISIVWSARDALAAAAAVLSPKEFAERVRELGARALGDLELISRIATFPLRQVRVERVVAPGVALIGDAAHGVHPLAGQGLNLGFQDVRVLADELLRRSQLERPGDMRVLRRYARARREDVSAMQFVTDGLDRLFGSAAPGASWLRNAGLGIVERQPWIKGALSDRAMR